MQRLPHKLALFVVGIDQSIDLPHTDAMQSFGHEEQIIYGQRLWITVPNQIHVPHDTVLTSFTRTIYELILQVHFSPVCVENYDKINSWSCSFYM